MTTGVHRRTAGERHQTTATQGNSAAAGGCAARRHPRRPAEELAAYKAARSTTWQPGKPAFLNARAKRWTRNAIAQHAIPPALEEANRQRREAGLPAIREEVTPHTLRYTCIASLFAAGADQEYVAAQVGHEDVTTTNRIYRYVLQRRRRGEIGRRRQLAMRESASDVVRSEHVPTRAREP